MNTATQTGAADPDIRAGEVVVKENPRQAAIDAMTARMEASRESELAEAVAADPGLAFSQNAINAQIKQANDEAIAAGTLELLPDDTDGAASREPMHKKDKEVPKNLEGDPLSEYIVMEKGQPMFQAKVNGELKLIPLEQARRQIQIGTAAEVRMQQAASFEQNTTQALEKRERDIATREAALLQRTNAVAQPKIPAQTDFSDADLLNEAREIFSTAFSGTEEDAAKKLARTLSKLRSPGVVPVVPIDENAIASRAARAAVAAVQNVDKERDVKTGYIQFLEDYPDIIADPNLYKMADDMTDGIEKEHPEWKISQVMSEAGKRTRAWVNELKGIEAALPTKPEVPKTPALTLHPTQNRQERKTGLVRMPQAAAGAVHESTVNQPEREQTPQEALAELKTARGQPN